MRNCAPGLRPTRPDCRLQLDQCPTHCLDDANGCGFACGAAARTCFTTARANVSRLSHRLPQHRCRASRTACASAADPEACLEDVGQAHGACLDGCGAGQGVDLGAWASDLQACKQACRSESTPDGAGPRLPGPPRGRTPSPTATLPRTPTASPAVALAAQATREKNADPGPTSAGGPRRAHRHRRS